MTMSLTRDEARASASGMTAEERKVILASSFGALMEWYDFYIYAALAVYFGALFFPKGNETAAFLASLATFGAGFLIRPVGALLFGRLGDLIGRKYTFLVTILLMGIATVGVGVLPTYEQIGIAATVLLVLLRLLQGLALGGEVGGAVTYVAEHSPASKRGLYTSSLQTTATYADAVPAAARAHPVPRHGVRADGRLHGRAVPGPRALHLAVPALPPGRGLGRRHAVLRRHGNECIERRRLLRALVSGDHRGRCIRDWHAVRAGDARSRPVHLNHTRAREGAESSALFSATSSAY